MGSVVLLHDAKAPQLFSPDAAHAQGLEMAPSFASMSARTEKLDRANPRVEAFTTAEEAQSFITALSLKNAAEEKASSSTLSNAAPSEAVTEAYFSMRAPSASSHKSATYLSRSGTALTSAPSGVTKR